MASLLDNQLDHDEWNNAVNLEVLLKDNEDDALLRLDVVETYLKQLNNRVQGLVELSLQIQNLHRIATKQISRLEQERDILLGLSGQTVQEPQFRTDDTMEMEEDL